MTRKSSALSRKHEAQLLHTDEQCNQMLELFRGGASYAELRRQFGGSTFAVRGALERAGAKLPIQKSRINEGEVTTIVSMVANGHSVADAARALGRSPTAVGVRAREMGLEVAPRRGVKAATWAGGEWVHGSSGYVMCWTPDDSVAASMRNKLGYTLKYRRVMAEHLNRPLLASETVHHINGNKLDNGIENLQLRHGKHGKGVVLRCRDCHSPNLEHVPLAAKDAE